MYLGRIMEVGDSETVFSGPNHPYTEALLSAVPNVDGEDRARILLEGEIPSPANPPTGCVFNTRCHRAIAGPVRGDRAAAHRGRAGPPDELPHPARGAADPPAPADHRGAGDVEAAVAEAAETTGRPSRSWPRRSRRPRPSGRADGRAAEPTPRRRDPWTPSPPDPSRRPRRRPTYSVIAIRRAS